MRASRPASLLALALLAGCGPQRPSSAEIARSIQDTTRSLSGNAVVRNERLLKARAVARFYEAREGKPAWRDRRKARGVVEAIRGVEADGLTPRDYHLEAIERLMREGDDRPDAARESDLDLLLTDAVAAIVDHVRYGRVRPVTLDPHWNVDPREGAPPLETQVAEIASAPSSAGAIQGAKPDHFIYRGLVGALARLREIEAKGGWGTVPSGKVIPPGRSDPRIPTIRQRLAISGELNDGGSSTSTVYDARLQEAVKRFQARHRLEETGIIGKDTIEAMNVSAAQRIGQVRVNLERARWVLGGLQGDFLLVNLPAYKAYLIQNGQNVWEARTQIGEEALQTPSFRAVMKTVVLNPDWTVPPSILANEIIEGMRRGKNPIAAQGLRIVDEGGNEIDPSSIDWGSVSPDGFPAGDVLTGYTVRQPPGEDNALGRVKFLFPNRYSIYLHDTPSQHLFDATKRTFSHGCIRLERALELADLLLGPQGWSRARIDQVLASGETENVALERELAVVIVYWTVSVGASGEIRTMKDVYDQDGRVLAALNAPPR